LKKQGLKLYSRRIREVCFDPTGRYFMFLRSLLQFADADVEAQDVFFPIVP
jgi:hypothetical protein